MTKIIKLSLILTGLFSLTILLSGLSITIEELKMILALLLVTLLIIILPMKELNLKLLKKGQITLGFYLSGYLITIIYIANAFSESLIIVNVLLAARPLLYSYLFSRIVTLTFDQLESEYAIAAISFKFTNKEQEIIEDLKGALTNKEIAKKHFIAESTVKRHIHNILKKTNCKNRIELLEVIKKSD